MITIYVDGMRCEHCKNAVEGALNKIKGVSATVNLAEKCVTVTMKKPVAIEILEQAITDVGFTVVSYS